MIASVLSTCAHTHTHTHITCLSIYLSLYTDFLYVSSMTLGRNHGTDVTSSNKWLKLNLTLQEETMLKTFLVCTVGIPYLMLVRYFPF